MLSRIYKNWTHRQGRRHRQTLEDVRGEFGRHGYDLRDVKDSDLETAITFHGGSIEDSIPLTGKKMYWTLRRLSRDKKPVRRN